MNLNHSRKRNRSYTDDAFLWPFTPLHQMNLSVPLVTHSKSRGAINFQHGVVIVTSSFSNIWTTTGHHFPTAARVENYFMLQLLNVPSKTEFSSSLKGLTESSGNWKQSPASYFSAPKTNPEIPYTCAKWLSILQILQMYYGCCMSMVYSFLRKISQCCICIRRESETVQRGQQGTHSANLSAINVSCNLFSGVSFIRQTTQQIIHGNQSRLKDHRTQEHISPCDILKSYLACQYMSPHAAASLSLDQKAHLWCLHQLKATVVQ